MKPHTKIYMTAFGYTIADFIPCEICGQKSVDVNHIDARGMGGDPQGKKDVIENLMGTCRKHHDEYGDVPEKRDWLIETHKKFMNANGVKNSL